MRLLTWNILHGGGPRRIPEIALSILGHAPDVVVLTEFRPGRGGQIRGVLSDHGLLHQLASVTPERANGLLIASKWPLDVLATAPPSPELAPKWLAAEVLTPSGPVAILGVHIPDDSRPTAKAVYWRRVVEVGREWSGRAAIIAGDLNTGRHRVDEEGSSFGCTTAMGELWTAGFRDVYRERHPEGRDTSWTSHEERGFRVDAVWASPELVSKVVFAAYSQAERIARTSDHAPLVVEWGDFRTNFDSKSKNTVENCQKTLF